jgi:hypothetical protein
MFLLNANLDPAQPWQMSTQFSALSLAYVRRQEPNRQWLLYTYAPLGDVRDVEITVPGYGDVVVDVALGGSFYLIDESTDGIVPISSNGS